MQGETEMDYKEDTKLTDSLERILIEREANAMRGAAFAAIGSSIAGRIRRLARLAASTVASLRHRAKDAKVDYAAG